MGMAASQARLLSITSRMADNELRSQMINNAKMRLTSESAQVSEKYLAALNETQLMFNNYSLTGEQQFQNLSFNSLTAYSSYNNQYGLRNRGGELLVSELDAARFKGAKDIATKELDGKTSVDDEKALEEFLKSYGIEKSTTYFDNIPESTNFNFDKKTAITIANDDFKKLYGVDGQNYEALLRSANYAEYSQLVANYNLANDAYKAATKKLLKTELDETMFDGKTAFKDILNEVNAYTYQKSDGTTTIDSYKTYLKKIMNELTTDNSTINLKLKGSTKDSTLYKTITEDEYYAQEYEKIKDRYQPADDNETYAPVDGKNVNERYDENGNKVNPAQYYRYDTKPNDDAIEINETENTKYYLSTTKPDNYTGYIYLVYTNSETEYLKDEAGKDITKHDENFNEGQEYILIDHYTTTEEDYVNYIKNLWKYLEDYIVSNIDFTESYLTTKSTGNANIFDLYTKRDEAWNKLNEFIFGINSANKLDISININNIDEVMKYIFSNNISNDIQGEFQTMLDLYKCELMLDEYGVPKYTYIDVNNPNENADAKAQWYINLFNRMNDGGYKAIESGLASSSDWLKFALESGQVTMEQVNKDHKWVSTMYSNCSCISESAIDIDITVAEAEYNQAMKKIEAKDKRYDMELKNIDTEHQSLQTEYDSIKTAIDKNIERHFKFFSA